jgi:nitric oxide reductase NorD protein
VALDPLRRRLELLLSAMYGRAFQVGVVAPGTIGASGGAGEIRLPATLDARAGVPDTIARYRLLAIAQAARLARDVERHVPATDVLARDLFLLAESAAAERDVVRRAPKLVDASIALRSRELAQRPPLARMARSERVVEQLLRELLTCSPESIPPWLPAGEGPAASRAWALATAEEIRQEAVTAELPYRVLRLQTLWGLAWSSIEMDASPFGGSSGVIESRSRDDDANEDESRSADDGTDRERSDAAGSGESADESSDEPMEREAPRERAASADEHRPRDGQPYPEWDMYGARLIEHGATVTCSLADDRDGTWAREVLREHASLVREVRARFAPLRARRLRLRHQLSGDALDIEACVTSLVDRRMGRTPSDRLYQEERSARHSVAILLLADVSGSTRAALPDGRTVLDVERTALLLAGEALGTLGDPFAMLAFSGCGAHGVRVRTVKAFADRHDDLVHRRISSLAPSENTRMGAAVRHATAVLRAQPAQRRILLVLSDGQPNDVNGYQGEYAIEDSRHAVLAARTSGVHTFCITVDQEEHEYLPHLFGANGYRVLQRPEQLPKALLGVVNGLLRG